MELAFYFEKEKEMTFSNILMCQAKKSLEQTLREMNGVKVYKSQQDRENSIYATQPENRCVSPYAEHVERYSEPNNSSEATGYIHWLGYIPYWK